MLVMCYECDTWQPSQCEYDDKGFCSETCMNEYKNRQILRAQERIDEIDEEMRRLWTERSRKTEELGLSSEKENRISYGNALHLAEIQGIRTKFR